MEKYKDRHPILVSDFIDEFVDKLQEQLRSDYAKWGNTWLDRPKEGQVARTEARYRDYFDQFYATGEPMPWMKVIGGALICWIKDNHPELCIDVNEVIAEDMQKIGLTGVKVSEKGVEDIVNDLCPVSGESNCAACALENDCDKCGPEFAAGRVWREIGNEGTTGVCDRDTDSL